MHLKAFVSVHMLFPLPGLPSSSHPPNESPLIVQALPALWGSLTDLGFVLTAVFTASGVNPKCQPILNYLLLALKVFFINASELELV